MKVTTKTPKKGNNLQLDIQKYKWIEKEYSIENPLYPENYVSEILRIHSENKFDNIIIQTNNKITKLLNKYNITIQ